MRRAFLLASVLGACTPSTRWIAPPPLPGAAALIVAFEDADGIRLEARATDSPDLRFESPASQNGRLTIELLSYDRPLAALGIGPGPIPLATSASRPGPLPAGAQPIYRLELTGARAEAKWEEVDTISPSLAAVRIALPPGPEAGCAEFDVQLLNLETAEDVAFAIKIDADRLLLGTFIAELFLLTVSSGERHRVAITSSAALTVGALGDGFIDDRGRVWLGADGGVVWRAESFTEPLHLEPITTTSSAIELLALKGGSTPSGFELFALSAYKQLEHWDGRAWTTLAIFPPLHSEPGSLLRLGPGELLVAVPSMRCIYHLRPGQAPIMEEIDSTVSALEIASTPIGPVCGTPRGEILTPMGGHWRLLGNSQVGVNIQAFATYDGGFIYSGTGAFLGQYLQDSGFACKLAQPAAFDVQGIVPFGAEDLVLFGSNPAVNKTPVAILRRRTP